MKPFQILHQNGEENTSSTKVLLFKTYLLVTEPNYPVSSKLWPKGSKLAQL